jgi:HAD superfamily hydrolase (TIGR01459 family)
MLNFTERYPVWLCDIWGVVHDGVRPVAGNVAGLMRHRARGGIVVLVTNSPRTREGVRRQLDDIGVDRTAYDTIITSGDVTRGLMESHAGGRVYHLGPDRDLSIFEGIAVERVPIARAHAVLCTGLFDDRRDSLADYHMLLSGLARRRLTMICANPDKIVRNGDLLLPCAGALAELYAERGGSVLMAGKPFAPIYDLALAEVGGRFAGPLARDQVLAIGDGPDTDIRGAADYGLDALMVADGITDASAGLAAVESAVRAKVPHARIVATVHDLGGL